MCAHSLQALDENKFDHYTAIYYLLLERLHCHRVQLPGDSRTQDARKRRPSTIADQAMMHNNAAHRPALASVKAGLFSRTTDCVILPQQGLATARPYDITSPLNTSPTGPCGNMITTSIDEGVGLDMGSDPSKTQGIYNSSIALDGMHTNSPFNDGSTGVLPSNVFGDLSQMASMTISNQSISTGIGSAFTSFDSNAEADLVSSLSSATPYTCGGVGPAATAQLFGATTMSNTSKFGPSPDAACVCPDALDDRKQMRSPIHFREGRRASDGLMTQGIIVFKQRLKDSMKTRGVAELQKEVGNLHHHCDMTCTMEELQTLQEQHPCMDGTVASARQWSLNDSASSTPPSERPKVIVKRNSLPCPGQTDMIPASFRLMHLNLKSSADGCSGSNPTVTGGDGSSFTSPVTPSAKSLQQQLLHYRLQQKRQIFQKQSQQQQQLPLHQQQLHHHQLFQQFQAMNIESTQPNVIHEEDSASTNTTANKGHSSTVPAQNCLAGTLANGQDAALPPGVNLMQFPMLHGCLPAEKEPSQPVACNNAGVAAPPKPNLASFRQMSYKLAQQHPVAPLLRGEEFWQQAEQPLSTMIEEGAETDGAAQHDRSAGGGGTSEHSQDDTAATSMDTC